MQSEVGAMNHWRFGAGVHFRRYLLHTSVTKEIQVRALVPRKGLLPWSFA